MVTWRFWKMSDPTNRKRKRQVVTGHPFGMAVLGQLQETDAEVKKG